MKTCTGTGIDTSVLQGNSKTTPFTNRRNIHNYKNGIDLLKYTFIDIYSMYIHMCICVSRTETETEPPSKQRHKPVLF